MKYLFLKGNSAIEFTMICTLEKGSTITTEHYLALLDKLKQQLVSKRRGRLSKGILFPQDNAASHKAAITHQKLADLHFEVRNTRPTHLISPLPTTTSD
jgi:hypothetical protein